MYRDVCGVKEPTPLAEDVERFSQGQDADPSLRGGQAPAADASLSQEGRGSRNPLNLLRRRLNG